MKMAVFWDVASCILIAQCNIPQDSHPHIHCHENLKCHRVQDIQVQDGKFMVARRGCVGREVFRIVK
jgi:hypothetical protein